MRNLAGRASHGDLTAETEDVVAWRRLDHLQGREQIKRLVASQYED